MSFGTTHSLLGGYMLQSFALHAPPIHPLTFAPRFDCGVHPGYKVAIGGTGQRYSHIYPHHNVGFISMRRDLQQQRECE